MCSFSSVANFWLSLKLLSDPRRTTGPTWTSCSAVACGTKQFGDHRYQHSAPPAFLSPLIPSITQLRNCPLKICAGHAHERCADVLCPIAIGSSQSELHLRQLVASKPYRFYNENNLVPKAETRLDCAIFCTSTCSPRWPSLWLVLLPSNKLAVLVR